MRLKQLKIAGFKSFVEPCILRFPSQKTGIVGPNGCGKSNIIDAIRWVIGESLAKNLRGESMTDVIFNGSKTRKPIGQAMVELVLDNSANRLTGPYSVYQEIAIKRVLTRDGISSYFLNDTQCRRRDIMEIFLGTGAGSRGYSIISQGTVSKIIESRPEELRIFIEEAAGVSKYKERRRETLIRIEHTQQNLSRIADIQAELGKQLHKLERQSEAAKRYHCLREEEKRYKLHILTLKRNSIENEVIQLKQLISKTILDCERQQTLIAQIDQQSITAQADLHLNQDALDKVQAHFYQLSTEIALLTEQREQTAKERQRLLQDQQQSHYRSHKLTIIVQENIEAITLYEAQHAALEQQVIQLKQENHSQEAAIQQAEAPQQQHLTLLESLQKQYAHLNEAEKITQLKYQHSVKQQQTIQQNLIKLENKQRHSNTEESACKNNYEAAQCDYLLQEHHKAEKEYVQFQPILQDLREQLKILLEQLTTKETEYHVLNTQKAVLEAQLNTRLPRMTAELSASSGERLFEVMQVEEPWRTVCEWVLGLTLQASVVEDIKQLLPTVNPGKSLEAVIAMTPLSHPKGVTLADKIKGFVPYHPINLSSIILVEDIKAAFNILPSLEPGQSVLTPQGCWLSHGWIRILGEVTKQEVNIFNLQEALMQAEHSLKDSSTDLTALKTEKAGFMQLIKEAEDTSYNLQQSALLAKETYQHYQLHLTQQTQTLQRIKQIQEQFAEEQQIGMLQLRAAEADSQGLMQSLQQIQAEKIAVHEALQQANHEKMLVDEGQKQLRKMCQETREKLYQTQLQSERVQLLIKQKKSDLMKSQGQLSDAARQADLIEKALAAVGNIETMDKMLQAKNKMRVVAEEKLTHLKALSQSLHQTVERCNHTLSIEENAQKLMMETLQAYQLQLNTCQLQSQNLLENSYALTSDLEESLIAETSIETLENLLQKTVEKITKLGAINLAAIAEFEEALERKQYLDSQYVDLSQALATLENAIKKMDLDTLGRIKETFDAINKKFVHLFPQLFGGGSAFLKFTGEDLLEAGILIMAQPPGKKNSTIHLLSGGEKALTAIALVFAMFQLNPSPFCLLDEVDAPLDEVNVSRFCNLVKEMSQYIQFLFISHNKKTMELADDLIGITMQELGVSRVVTVELNQAISNSALIKEAEFDEV